MSTNNNLESITTTLSLRLYKDEFHPALLTQLSAGHFPAYIPIDDSEKVLTVAGLEKDLLLLQELTLEFDEDRIGEVLPRYRMACEIKMDIDAILDEAYRNLQDALLRCVNTTNNTGHAAVAFTDPRYRIIEQAWSALLHARQK